MQWLVEDTLSNFQFWSGAKDTAAKLTTEQLDSIGEQLEEIFGHIPTDTEINDLFWFDEEFVFGLVGIKTDDDGDVIEDMEEWAGEIIADYNARLHEIYFDDFWYDASITGEPDWSSRSDVIDAFKDYVEDNWPSHALEILNDRFPELSKELKDEFVDNEWDTTKDDDDNVFDFEQWLEKQNEED